MLPTVYNQSKKCFVSVKRMNQINNATRANYKAIKMFIAKQLESKNNHL